MIRNRQLFGQAAGPFAMLLATLLANTIVSSRACAADVLSPAKVPVSLDENTQNTPDRSGPVGGATAEPTVITSSGPSVIPAGAPGDALKAPPATVEVRTYGLYSFRTTWQGDADVQTDHAGTAVDLAVPLALPLRFNLSVIGEFSHYGFSNTGAFLPEPRFAVDGYALAIQPGLGLALSQQLAIFGGPTIQSTAQFGANFQRSLTYGGDMGVYYKIDSKLSVAIGAGGSSRLSHAPFLYPVIGVDWQFNDDWHAVVQTQDFGTNARLSRRLVPNVFVSLLGGYAQREYRLRQNSVEPGGLLRDFYVPVGLELAYVCDSGPSIRVDLGTSIVDDIRFDNNSGDKVARHSAHPAPFVGLAAAWKF